MRGCVRTSADVSALSATGGLALDIASISSMQVRGGEMSSQSSITVTLPGEKPHVRERSSCYTGGRWYVDEDGSKTWRAAALGGLLPVQAEPIPLVLIDEIRTSSSVYTLTYHAAGLEYYQEKLARAFGNAWSRLSISELTTEVHVEDRVLSTLSTGVTAEGSLSSGEEVSIRAKQTSRVTARGDAVTVGIPSDLAAYTQAS